MIIAHFASLLFSVIPFVGTKHYFLQIISIQMTRMNVVVCNHTQRSVTDPRCKAQQFFNILLRYWQLFR